MENKTPECFQMWLSIWSEKGVLVEAESVSFRSFDEAWRPIEEVAEILDSLWIDEVIANGLVTCHAQPILNGDEEVIAYEMLARFYREDGSVIFPGEIFSAARKRSRLYALDRLCRMTAVRFASFIDKKHSSILYLQAFTHLSSA